MSQWLKTLTGSLCILTVLLHLIPQGKFARYVRFYAGLLFFLVAAGPLWKLLAGEGTLERILQIEFLKEEFSDLSSSVEGMAELKNDQIRAVYQGEIFRQIREIASAYGAEASKISLSFDAENEYLLTGVSFSVSGTEEGGAAVVEKIRDEIAGVYMLEPNRIRVRSR